MARKNEWIAEFISHYDGHEKSAVKSLALAQADLQEMANGSIVDVWTPADFLAQELTQKSREKTQAQIMEDLFNEYDFGQEVCAFNGWNFDGVSTYQRSVFLDNGKEDSTKVIFYVSFFGRTNQVESVGVLD